MQHALEGFARRRPDLAGFTMSDDDNSEFESLVYNGTLAYEWWMISQTWPTKDLGSLQLKTYQEINMQTAASMIS